MPRKEGSKNYTEKKKIEVVTTYLALGKAPMVEAVTGVPRGTIRIWKMQPWWKELESEIRNEETLELDAKLSKIVNKSLDLVADRLDNGDFMYDPKSGKVKRIPVKMRDAERVSSNLIDKRQLIRKNPVEKAMQQQQFEDRLLKLAEQFAEFALGKKAEPRVIEGEVINAVHDQREEGLQEGTFLGAQEETESGEGSFCSEQSEVNDDESRESQEGGWEGRGPQKGAVQGWSVEDVQSSDAEPVGEPFIQPQ